jgi:hypothetical protein
LAILRRPLVRRDLADAELQAQRRVPLATNLTLHDGPWTARYVERSATIARHLKGASGVSATMKAKLVTCLLEEARWRDAKAGGGQNASSVLALASAARAISSWPDDDRRLWQLEALQATSSTDVFSPCEESRRLIRRYGFARGSWSSAEGLVTLMLDAEIRASAENLDVEMRWPTMADDEDA